MNATILEAFWFICIGSLIGFLLAYIIWMDWYIRNGYNTLKLNKTLKK